MKKLLVVWIMLVYGLSSSGMTLHFHYCCGKLDKIILSAPDRKGCSRETISTKGCCDNKHVELKVKVDQEPITKWISNYKATPALVHYQPLPYPVYVLLDRPVNEYSTGPPITDSSLPLFIKNCVYRI